MPDNTAENEYWTDSEDFERDMVEEDLPEGTITPSRSGSRTLRVERELRGSWSGVSGCNDPAIARRVLHREHQAFMRDVLLEYRHLRYLNSAAHATGYRVERGSRGFPDDRRWCRGQLVRARAWATFEY